MTHHVLEFSLMFILSLMFTEVLREAVNLNWILFSIAGLSDSEILMRHIGKNGRLLPSPPSMEKRPSPPSINQHSTYDF